MEMKDETQEICKYCGNNKLVAVTLDLGKFVVGWDTNRPRMCVNCATKTLPETMDGYIRTPSGSGKYKDEVGILDSEGNILPCEFVTVPNTRWELVTPEEKIALNQMRNAIDRFKRPVKGNTIPNSYSISETFFPGLMGETLGILRKRNGD